MFFPFLLGLKLGFARPSCSDLPPIPFLSVADKTLSVYALAAAQNMLETALVSSRCSDISREISILAPDGHVAAVFIVKNIYKAEFKILKP